MEVLKTIRQLKRAKASFVMLVLLKTVAAWSMPGASSSTESGIAQSGIEIELATLATLTESRPSAEREYSLLYLWASWCPDCREKLKGELQEFVDRKEINLFALNVDRDKKRALDFLQGLKAPLPSFVDENRKLVPALKLFSVPSWALTRRSVDGKVSVIHTGAGSDLKVIEKLIAEERK